MEELRDDQYCFEDRNSSCRKSSLSTSIYITLYIISSIISAVTVFLNLLVIISISHFKQLHTPTNLLILSLAVSDLLVGLFVIPALTVAMMESCWVQGEYFCALLMFITFLCSASSVGNLILISIDRYVAVCDPLSYHSKITIVRITFCITFSWCFFIIYNAAFMKTYVNVKGPSKCFKECVIVEGDIWSKIIDLVMAMFVPCSVIITLYLKIFVVARSQARQIFSKEAATVSGIKTVQANKSERKAAKTLGIVVFNYMLCWNPFFYLLCIVFNSNDSASFLIFLPLVNSFINPIIYAFYYPWFKVTGKLILTMKLRPSYF